MRGLHDYEYREGWRLEGPSAELGGAGSPHAEDKKPFVAFLLLVDYGKEEIAPTQC